ncbi:hypothetical protein QZH41_017203, partial [Actinostola sp. cb2023]
FFWQYMVTVHLVKYCLEVGITAQQGSNLFIFIGVCSLIATVVAGRVMDIQAVNPFHVNQIGSLMMALCMILIQMATKYYHFIIFSFFFGLGIGIFRTTVAVLFLNTVEPALVPYAWPFAEIFTSTGNAMGAPFTDGQLSKTDTFLRRTPL